MFRHLLRSRRHVCLTERRAKLLLANTYATEGDKDQNKEAKKKDENDDLKSRLVQLSENPIHRTTTYLKKEMRSLKESLTFWKSSPPLDDEVIYEDTFPHECDVLIIGGGVMGSAIAYYLKQRARYGLKIVVVEKDPTYQTASTPLSVGGLRQQFSVEENIEMSLYSADFIRQAHDYLGMEGEPPINLQYHPAGYLSLATEENAGVMEENSKLQVSLGAKNILLTPEMIKQNFPWMNMDGVALGCLGLEKEGWFDSWSLLYAFKKKALSLQARYIHGQVKAFEFDHEENLIMKDSKEPYIGINKAFVETPDNNVRPIVFSKVVIAAGANSGEIARMAKIGAGTGILSVPLPVEPRKRYVYCFHSPDGPGLNTPLTVDTTGTYFRREGLANHYLCGRSPDPNEEPSTSNLDVDHEFFEANVWPPLAHRVPAFENLKVNSSWAGFYEYNTFDENGIIGPHPYYFNMFFATGFSGHGIQQAPAVGRAITELIMNDAFMTIDLTRLGFDRFITLEPLKEKNVV